jgi:hypothetical protein
MRKKHTLQFVTISLVSTAILFACNKEDDKKQKTDPTPDIPAEEIVYGEPKCSSGWDIYKAGTYRYGPCFIINDDGSIDAWFAPREAITEKMR